MVFLIQNTQNRDSREIHLKLDELLRAIKPARTSMAFLEDLSDADLEKLHQQFTLLKKQREEKDSTKKKDNVNSQKTK
jgi:low affinity Fe/Cu permease